MLIQKRYSSLDKETIKKLEAEGWVVECESPLEIRHEESESFASGWAAQIVIEYILDNPGCWSGE